MLKFAIALLVGLAFLPLVVAAPALASANDQIFHTCQTHSDSTLCQDEKAQNVAGTNPVNHYIHVAANIIAILTGVAAIIMIIVSGIKFIGGGGSPEAVKSARGTLLAAVIGLAIIALAWSVINFAIDNFIK